MPELSFGEVGEILQLVQAIEGSEVDLEWGDLKIQVRRGSTSPAQTALPAAAGSDSTASAVPPATVAEVAPQQRDVAPGSATSPSPSVTPAPVAEASGTPAHWVAIVAPMVGTCYRSPSPEEAPFVEVGDVVTAGDTVALIEVMKLFTELKAEIDGKVARIDITDGELVEFGQSLVWIEPS